MKTKTNAQYGFTHVGIFAAIGVLAIVGFAGWRVTQSKDIVQSTKLTKATEAENPLPLDVSNLKSIEEVRAIAQNQQPDKDFVGIELESEHTKLLYVVHFSDGTILVFDAISGDQIVMDDNGDDDIDDSAVIPSSSAITVSLQDAISAAKAQHPDVSVKKVELEIEDAVLVYSIRFVDGTRVDISASDGSVRRVNESDNDTSDDSSTGHDDSKSVEDSNDESHNSPDDNESDSSDSNDDSSDDKAEHDENESEDNSGSGSHGH